jgi:hypothetical protein
MRRARKTGNATRRRTVAGALGCAPAQLVGLGFRFWLTGFRNGDITCWERVWSAYSAALGGAAKGAVSDLACWVSSISCHTQRDLKIAAIDCDRFCRDECLAIDMIAACQHDACPAMRACAFALLGCSMIEAVVEGAESFAATMRDADQVLPPSFTHDVTLLALPTFSATRQ